MGLIKKRRFLAYSITLILFLTVLIVLPIIFQEKFLFFPEKLDPDYKFQFMNPHEEIWITNGGAKLHGLLFKGERNKQIVLYFHGNAGSLRTWGGIHQDFVPYQKDVLIWDYRGFGKSTGDRSEENFYSDAELFYKMAVERYQEENVILYGRSIGTGLAIELARKHNPLAVFLEAPFTSLKYLAKIHYPYLPTPLILYKFDNLAKIGSIQCPIRMVHGTDDEIIPMQMTLSLIQGKSNVKFVQIQGGGHNNLQFFDEYWEFLDQSFSEIK